ncbi:3-hydroxyacyl-CoA dehydrogenase NAD-binding domain-containing protein [Reichenbachiella carrageenanivorans]|uniref:3-hydroxyacyl-CoA dehydrogenase NAD-binding domain-containing protein n=1 Tax=Reichenbachiella carrageenanivorans TaxID=2979869 RepID=A0ABY6CY78_9BACT|nr:3-hydroxyacyl-CoA dehydrogenase NAD-binding domain-containing protein [Reichenbachiella carrageenanivorans]UXX78862.1 3-hydroxyacyl-CoA dehydrogenase NAD-binding domain-containing protein [Reichenbachiella carrageenanivorans]
MKIIGIIGAGSMGSGIAQVAATAGHEVVLLDSSNTMLQKAQQGLNKILARLVEKGNLSKLEAGAILDRIHFTGQLEAFENCDLIIEAIVEDLSIKKQIFRELETIVNKNCILATNTSSLSVSAIASASEKPHRVLGIHFFNPAPLMPLVEIIPAIQTDQAVVSTARKTINNWGKITVLAKDTPGFIVNRVARPFYGEALRILEEGIADVATIDWAMTEIGGFRMGPFTLMDFIGNDINYTVTETVFKSFFYDPRYKPAFTQKRMAEAGYLGRKSGKGYYNYSEGTTQPEPDFNQMLGKKIFNRILVMLINEAADALFWNIASKEDIDLAMTKGVNYPAGLLRWADEYGIDKCVKQMDSLYNEYLEDRYRCSPLLRKMVRENKKFY